MTKFKIAISLSLLSFGIWGCSQSPTNSENVQKPTYNSKIQPANVPKTTEATPDAPAAAVDELAAGKELYAINCMICHKDTGKGGKVTVEGKTRTAIDLVSENMKKKTDERLYQYISNGEEDEGMPSFADKLSESEIKSVIAHVRSMQKSS